jgi:hypothetical protein
MSGFCRLALEGEFYNQAIVNILHYRSSAWLPGQGNPFADTLSFLDSILAEVQTEYLACHTSAYTLRRASAVGYDDAYTIVTPSPLIRTIEAAGTIGNVPGMGAAQCAILGLRCGGQTQINGIGQSKRNRGYLAIGPLPESQVDEYSHIISNIAAAMDALAQHLDNTIVVLSPAVTLVPIRVHEKWTTLLGHKVLDWRTYSDVLGYSVSSVASYRRSRKPEA